MSLRIIALNLLTFIFFSETALSLALPKEVPNQNSDALSLGVEGVYELTSANYSSKGGEFESLPNDGFLQIFSMKTFSHYHLGPNWTFGGGLLLSSLTSDDGNFERSRTEVTEFSLRTRYWLLDTVIQAHLELDFTLPLIQVDLNSDEALPGDGAMEIEPGLWLTSQFWVLQVHTYFGYRNVDQKRAQILPWRLGLTWQGDQWDSQLELLGQSVLSKDTGENRTLLLDRVNAGSFRYAPKDPESLAARGSLGWSNPSFRFSGFVSQTMDGSNSANTLVLGGQLEYRWNFDPKETIRVRRSYREKESLQQESLKRFEPNETDYDEEVFEKARPQPKVKLMKKKKRKKRRLKRQKKKKIEKLLNETEKFLESQ